MTKLRLLAVGIVATWAAWWAFFAFAQKPPLVIASGVTLVLFGIPLLAWIWKKFGGALLIAEALALLMWLSVMNNPPATKLFLVVTLALPPLAAGILMLVGAPPNPSVVRRRGL